MVNLNSPRKQDVFVICCQGTVCSLEKVPLFSRTTLAEKFQRNLIGLFTTRLSKGADVEQNSEAEL